MTNKIYLWIGMFLISINVAVAQTGLFTAEGAGSFAITGVQFVILAVVARLVIRDLARYI